MPIKNPSSYIFSPNFHFMSYLPIFYRKFNYDMSKVKDLITVTSHNALSGGGECMANHNNVCRLRSMRLQFNEGRSVG